MKGKITVYDVIKANIALGKLLKQQSSFDFSLSYSIYKLRSKLDEIEKFAMERLSALTGGKLDVGNMTDAEKLVYTGVMSAEIDDELPYLPLEKLLSAEGVKADVADVEFLEKVTA